MNKVTLKQFEKELNRLQREVLFNDRIVREDFCVNGDDRFDEVDQASSDIEQGMRMRMRNRESILIKKIEAALKRIEDGIFGLCELCEEPIELKRLRARPVANLCIGCKEEEEGRETRTAKGREHKSLGESFSRSFS
ncbi:MAG: TraR/DksA C4-type zinc finger protein [Bdellovibrionota bacterium]